MKCFLSLVAALALTLPAVAQSDPATAPASTQAYGLTTLGRASTSVTPDTCYLFFPLSDTKQRQALVTALSPLGLVLDKTTRVPASMNSFPASFPTGVSASLTFRINDKGEVVFAPSSLSELSKTLQTLGVTNYFIFGYSPKAQEAARKPLVEQAIKDGMAQAVTLATAAGVSKLQLVELKENGFSSLVSPPASWPDAAPFLAPSQELSYSIKLCFAPLDLVIPIKK
ncbi:SIMPL domain-containing protein [Armatimonas rosea]|uniref:Uncharacterized protein YggE n=1 Tax=Armatimonas rosea TaxID=685828 RepID=A0A7W9SMK8_ARMRO|nr:SIMPL domain-containing protein [Armatimonas rosea]MBB6049401.1 uncharacterized protein YggE [Armatimonas rosea]